MPFPFMPFGAIFAGVILGAALTIFVWGLLAIDRAASRAASSVVTGLVSGFRGWVIGEDARRAHARSGRARPWRSTRGAGRGDPGLAHTPSILIRPSNRSEGVAPRSPRRLAS